MPLKRQMLFLKNLTFFYNGAIFRENAWGCTGFDGCANPCAASGCEGALN